MSYSPDPLHTDHIRLPQGLDALQELLAENVHEMWARQRMAEGWRYGPERNDQQRTHPCLIPYAQLPDAEKYYDRETAMETLRVLFAHGYRIVPPTEKQSEVASTGTIEQRLQELNEALDAAGEADLQTLIRVWRATSDEIRWHDLMPAQRFVERLLEFNEPLLAFDSVSEGLRHWPADTRLLQLKGISLARAGAAYAANQVFQQLVDGGHRDEETLGNLAGTYKTLWSQADRGESKQNFLAAAHNAYAIAYRLTDGYWSGINVAFLALMRGDSAEAQKMASEVYAQCKSELVAARLTKADTYWLTATLGEASLIRGEYQEAIDWYSRSSAIAGRRHGNIASTCRQARHVVSHLQLDWSRFAPCFPLPTAVVFCGGKLSSVLPEKLSDEFQTAIADSLRKQLTFDHPILGISHLSSWLDLLFLETVLELHGEIAAVIDAEAPDASAAGTAAMNPQFQQRAESVLAKCSEVHRLTARTGVATTEAQQYIDRVLCGLGHMQANYMGSGMIVCGTSTDCLGTATPTQQRLAKAAAAGQIQLLLLDLDIDIAALNRQAAQPDDLRSQDSASTILAEHSQIMALLFADIEGYSQLHESQLLTFSKKYLGAINELVQAAPRAPVTGHTWGDGLFFTFDRIADAGVFAIQLADLIISIHWEQFGLPADLGIRIGLHAGPVYACFDPISKQQTFCGIHVNHAARIEPITPTGNVYASEAFAALASEENVSGFVCEYVGQTPLAKNFGLFATYHVRRQADDEDRHE